MIRRQNGTAGVARSFNKMKHEITRNPFRKHPRLLSNGISPLYVCRSAPHPIARPATYGQLMELNLPHDVFIYRPRACNLLTECRQLARTKEEKRRREEGKGKKGRMMRTGAGTADRARDDPTPGASGP
jgi:hypothetical protein